MAKLPWLVVAFILGGLLLTACAGASPPSSAGQTAGPGGSAQKGISSQEWDNIVAEAKKEGSVTIYTIWLPEARIALTEAFRNKYGINLEFTPFSRGSDLVAKFKAEQNAGLRTADVFGAGATTLVVNMKPDRLLAPVEPVLMLPEVKDPKQWLGGSLPFADKEGQAFAMISAINRMTAYNTEQVKSGEITSYKDLLKPQYKGKVTIGDPSVSGGGNSLVTHLGHALWGEAETTDWLRQMIRDQGLVIERDSRIQVENVARGKYAVSIGHMMDVVTNLINTGLPIQYALVKEDNDTTASTGAMGIPVTRAHPNATIVFVNWLLSKEGQSVVAKSLGYSSARLDASKEGINPILVPNPSEKYYPDDEASLGAKDKWMKVAKSIMDGSLK